MVHVCTLTIKVVLEVPKGEAEETRLQKKVQPMQILMLQKSDLES